MAVVGVDILVDVRTMTRDLGSIRQRRAVGTASSGLRSTTTKPALTWPTGRARACRAPRIKPTGPAASCGTIRAEGCPSRRLLSRWGHDLDARRLPRWL